MPRPISATVDLDALRHNLRVARRHAAHTRLFAVVKANAYGHGLERAARALRGIADGYALLELDAAVRLRDAGYTERVALLEGYFDVRDMQEMAARGLSAVVHHFEQIDMMRELPSGSALDVLLKVNTGMNRLGLQPAEVERALEALRRHPGVGAITLLTHFARADDSCGIAWQMQALEQLPDAAVLPRCLANSAALLRYPQTHADWARPGIMLYGCSPFPGETGADCGLRPVMTLTSRIIAVRELSAGEAVGYGGTYIAPHRVRVGVVACGYADGYPRHAGTGTPVLVGDKLVSTVGRVSMDMLCVDLTAVPEAGIGAPVVLWGAGNPVERVAEAAGTISYELLCALAPRVPVTELAVRGQE